MYPPLSCWFLREFHGPGLIIHLWGLRELMCMCQVLLVALGLLRSKFNTRYYRIFRRRPPVSKSEEHGWHTCTRQNQSNGGGTLHCSQEPFLLTLDFGIGPAKEVWKAPKRVKNLYTESYKRLLSKTSNMPIIAVPYCLWVGTFNIDKISIKLKVIYKLNAVPVKISMPLYCKKKKILRYIQNHKGLQ